MKKQVLFTLLLLAGSAIFAQGQSRRVLFIGNSYTNVNDLPSLVAQVAQSMGDHLQYESNTPGGCTFQQHCNNASMTMIQQGGWDAVVLQEQSQLPSFPESQVTVECLPYAAQLVEAVYAFNACSEPMFYMTWGRKNGDQDNAQYFAPLGTYEGMDSLLYERYCRMAQDNDASVCPVGRVWRYIRTNHPDIELYQGDGSHPSMIGSYAAACAFYTMLFGGDPEQISYNPGIDEQAAAIVRRATSLVVYQQLENWQRPRPQAAFTVAADGRYENQSQHADHYLWYFGDGDSSVVESPLHQYAANGTYQVMLIARRHCMTDTMTLEVTVDNGGVAVSEAETVEMKVYPNPASHYLQVQGVQDAVLTDIYGRRVAVVPADGRLDVSNLPEGCYLLRTSFGTKPIVVAR